MVESTIDHNSILVVKLGGGDGLDLQTASDDLATIAQQRSLVVIHGISGLVNRMCHEAGIPVQMMTSPGGHSSRYTDSRTREVYVQAADRINRELVESLRERKVNAIGMAEMGIIIRGQRKQAIRTVVDGHVRIIRDDYSGRITEVDGRGLRDLLAMGYVPVLPPLASSDDGLLNVDGDRAGAAVAGSLNAAELVILSNVRGLYRNFLDETSIVPRVAYSGLTDALDWARGRMIRKVMGAQEAMDAGVGRVVIGDGRVPNPVSRALAGQGTEFILC